MGDLTKRISQQGYGWTLTGNSLPAIGLIDAGTPGIKVGTRETTTLANTAWVTKTTNKLKEAQPVDFLVSHKDAKEIKSKIGVAALYTMTIEAIYTYVAWGVISEIKGGEGKARSHDHELTNGFTIDWTLQDAAGTEVAPIETWL